MIESPASPETRSEPHAHLREALEYLEAHGLRVVIDGDRYVVFGECFTAGEVIQFAGMLTPAGLHVLQ